MVTRTTDTSSSEEEIYYTYYSSTECESDFEYEGKAGYINTCSATSEDVYIFMATGRKKHAMAATIQ